VLNFCEETEPLAVLQQRALAVPMQPLVLPALARRGIELIVRRDDLIDQQMSGNKFYKLFWNLQRAKARGVQQVASFGGAWSNHLYALAAVGQATGLKTLGVIRGDRPPVLSDTLRDVEAMGMTLCFVARETYRQLTREADQHAAFQQWLAERYGDLLLVPEGGANSEGARGAMAIGQAIEQQLQGNYHEVWVAAATGTTLAGLAAGLPAGKIAGGISVLKGQGSMNADICRLYRQLATNAAPQTGSWRLVTGFHAGGYAKKLPEALQKFQKNFEEQHKILLDPVYTLKLFFAIFSLAQAGYWAADTRLVVVHSGGLQGRRGFA
jgi:1-aminocyclopropane-1-carboxylate deaminase